MKQLLKNNTKKVLSGAMALTMVLGFSSLVASPVKAAGFTNISLSDTGANGNYIVDSSIATGTYLDSGLVIDFTNGETLSPTDTITFKLNGLRNAPGETLDQTMVAFTGACSGTPTMASVAPSAVNPLLTISGITCTTGAAELVIANYFYLLSSNTAGNYAINITTPYSTGSGMFYVGDENDIQVRALVESTLAFSIRTSADDVLNPNLCDLGTLTTSATNTCSYRLKVSTNANSYSVSVIADGALRSGSRDIDAITEDSTNVVTGTEGYGVEVASGASSEGGVTVSASGIFSDNDTPLPLSVTEMIGSDGPNSPIATDTTNTSLVTHKASIDAATAAGLYAQLLTYTVSASY